MLRIARIEYDHIPLEMSNDGISIGQQIDNQLHEIYSNHKLVQEVSVFLETLAEQQEVARFYATSDLAAPAYTNSGSKRSKSDKAY
jgi:hypothetical protein